MVKQIEVDKIRENMKTEQNALFTLACHYRSIKNIGMLDISFDEADELYLLFDEYYQLYDLVLYGLKPKWYKPKNSKKIAG